MATIRKRKSGTIEVIFRCKKLFPGVPGELPIKLRLEACGVRISIQAATGS